MKYPITIPLALIGLALLTACGGGSSTSEATAPQETAEPQLIPGLAPVDVYLNLEQRGFTVTKDLKPGACSWMCSSLVGPRVVRSHILHAVAAQLRERTAGHRGALAERAAPKRVTVRGSFAGDRHELGGVARQRYLSR
jgi:hypothetical protein